MEINDEKFKKCWFNDLKKGDVFLQDCVYYMKTADIVVGNELVYNAVSLYDGIMVGFHLDTNVHHVNCTLEIK